MNVEGPFNTKFKTVKEAMRRSLQMDGRLILYYLKENDHGGFVIYLCVHFTRILLSEVDKAPGWLDRLDHFVSAM